MIFHKNDEKLIAVRKIGYRYVKLSIFPITVLENKHGFQLFPRFPQDCVISKIHIIITIVVFMRLKLIQKKHRISLLFSLIAANLWFISIEEMKLKLKWKKYRYIPMLSDAETTAVYKNSLSICRWYMRVFLVLFPSFYPTDGKLGCTRIKGAVHHLR